MSAPVQFKFESAAFAGNAFAVRSAQWREALNTPYRAEIEVVIPNPDEDPLLLLGKNGVLTLTRESQERRLTGVVTQIEHVEPLVPSHTHVRVRVEPAMALLGLS